jgi:putative FmdB family regulatory protein
VPTYEYACQACSHSFEQFQSITAAPLRKCPACGKPRLQRLIGAGGGLIFRGSGFYLTDYRTDSYKKAADAEKKSTSGGGEKSDSPAKAEPPASAKPTAKPERKPAKAAP